MSVPTEVLHEVSIFMENGTDHHLHGRGVITENIYSIFVRVIHTIGGGIFVPEFNHPILKGPTLILLPDVCFAPLNCLAYNLPNLGGCHIFRLGLEV